jgi:hypothetical protein
MKCLAKANGEPEALGIKRIPDWDEVSSKMPTSKEPTSKEPTSKKATSKEPTSEEPKSPTSS